MLAAALTVSVPGLANTPYHGEGHIIVGAEELEWGDVASMDAGARITVLEGTLNQSEPFTFRLKLPETSPSCRLARRCSATRKRKP